MFKNYKVKVPDDVRAIKDCVVCKRPTPHPYGHVGNGSGVVCSRKCDKAYHEKNRTSNLHHEAD